MENFKVLVAQRDQWLQVRQTGGILVIIQRMLRKIVKHPITIVITRENFTVYVKDQIRIAG